MKPIARIRVASLLALLLVLTAHAQTVDLCQLLVHPEQYNGQMIHVHGQLIQTPTSLEISDNYCTAPLDLRSPFDHGIRVSFRPVRNRSWYKFWYYKSFPSEYSGKNPPFYKISGTFYGLFRYQSPKHGSKNSQWTLILASVSHIAVKKIKLPIMVIVPFTPPPYVRFPVSPPDTNAAPPDENLDWLFPVAPPVQVSGPRQ